MKNNISYYTHAADADTHWKFVALRRKFGWQGEGKFWALNNRIAKSEYCKLNLNDEELIEATAATLDFDPEEFIEYVGYLKKVRLVIEEDGFITTEIVQECLEEVMGRREYQRERAKGGSKKSIVENEKSIVENPKSTIENANSIIENEQSKVKKSKEKYNKEEERKDYTSYSPKESEKTTTTPCFKKPTIEEIDSYLKEKKITGFTAEKFHAYYESKGWLIGKTPMKNWKAAIVTWKANNGNNGFSSGGKPAANIGLSKPLSKNYDVTRTSL